LLCFEVIALRTPVYTRRFIDYMKNIGKDQITAVILAGGRGRRFEGRDKGLIEYKQCPIIEHVIKAIAPQVAGIMINANRSEAVYAGYGYPVINDELSGFQGPLAGFATAMKHAPGAFVLTLPCDGPFISPDYVRRMAATLSDGQADLVVAYDGNRMQPVHALLPVTLRKSLNDFLASGERKIDRWYLQHQVALVDFSDMPDLFLNINTLDELNALEDSAND
jgi:molybdenum cofactor guanylyltransferase